MKFCERVDFVFVFCWFYIEIEILKRFVKGCVFIDMVLVIFILFYVFDVFVGLVVDLNLILE